MADPAICDILHDKFLSVASPFPYTLLHIAKLEHAINNVPPQQKNFIKSFSETEQNDTPENRDVHTLSHTTGRGDTCTLPQSKGEIHMVPTPSVSIVITMVTFTGRVTNTYKTTAYTYVHTYIILQPWQWIC